MTFPDDPNLNNRTRAPVRDIRPSGFPSWGLPVGLVALLLLLGFIFLMPSTRSSTVSTNEPAVTRPAPVPTPNVTPPTPTPTPAPTTPKQ
jgi:hypothetical protein